MATEIYDTIVARVNDFMAAFDRGDAAGVAALYTEDAQILPPNADFTTGKQAIQAFWQGGMDMGLKSAKLEVLEVGGQGDLAYEVGKYKLYGAEEQEIDQGKYIVIWKQEDGQWKLHRDIWNSSRPAPG